MRYLPPRCSRIAVGKQCYSIEEADKSYMTQDILIGIDLGTTVLKAAAFDARSGAPMAQAHKRLEMRVGRDGAREQDAQSIDCALKFVMGKLKRELASLWQSVTGMGLAAQGGSGLIADRNTGHAFTPLYQWNDNRSLKQQAIIAAKKSKRYWRSLALRGGPGHGLGRLMWLRENQPRLISGNNIYAGAGEYVYFKLTGLWRQDACNALQTGCYNVNKQQLAKQPLELAGVPVSFVAPLRRNHETNPLSASAAEAFGLPEGIPVAGPYMDHEAGYLSASAVSAQPLQCSLGTAWVGNFILPTGTTGHSPNQLVLPSPITDGGRLVVQPTLTGNVTWDWGLVNLVHKNHTRALKMLDDIFAEKALPPSGLVELPWFARPNPLTKDLQGAGAFFGMNPSTNSHQMLRALALSMCCEMARVFKEPVESGAVDCVVLGGGTSKGGFFCAMLASLFPSVPVYTLRDEDQSGSRGTLYALSRKTSRSKARRVRLPGKAQREAIQEAYKLYISVFERLYGDLSVGAPFSFAIDRGKK
jgi:xylulokinase